MAANVAPHPVAQAPATTTATSSHVARRTPPATTASSTNAIATVTGPKLIEKRWILYDYFYYVMHQNFPTPAARMAMHLQHQLMQTLTRPTHTNNDTSYLNLHLRAQRVGHTRRRHNSPRYACPPAPGATPQK